VADRVDVLFRREVREIDLSVDYVIEKSSLKSLLVVTNVVWERRCCKVGRCE